MILRIRPFLVFVLMLLQFAAPLLHAHKNSVANFGTSIHLPEFEQVNTLLKHAPEFTAPTNHDESIIAISSGIKNETFQFLQTESIVFVLIGLFFIANTNKCSPLYFSFQTEPISDGHLLYLISPRAPPIFNVR